MSHNNKIYGPLYDYMYRCDEAIEFLKNEKKGVATDALWHPQLGFVDLPYGVAPSENEVGFGLAKLLVKHPEVLSNLQKIFVSTRILAYDKSGKKVFLNSDTHNVVVGLDWFEIPHKWLLTAFELDTNKKSFSNASTIDIRNSQSSSDWGENDTATFSKNDSNKDTTKNKPNQKIKLGAYEILSNNKADWDFKGYTPTYVKLSNYDRLIDPSLNNDKLLSHDGNIPMTMENILAVINKCSHQVRRLSSHLKASTKDQSVFNVWHWIKSNIPYGLEEGEQLRTPARSWSDSRKGIKCDCDDYAIMAACLLKEMGYLNPPPKVEIVAFNNKPQYSHIYTKLDGMILDGVMNEFNTKPLNVTKSMDLSILEGIGGKDFSGFGSIISEELLNIGQKLYDKERSGNISSSERRDLKKVLYILNNHPSEHAPLLGIMKHVDDITESGMVFKSDRINGLIRGLSGLGSIDAIDDYDLGVEFIPYLSGFTDDEFDVLQGLADLGKLKIGKGLKKLANAVKETITLPIKVAVKTTTAAVHVVAAAGDAAKDIATGHGSKVKADFKREIDKAKVDVKSAAKDAGSAVKAVATVVKSVSLSPVRGAVLLMLELNFMNHAKILSVGTGTLAQAKTRGYSESEYNDHVKAANNYRKMFEEVGGDGDTFKDAINKGMDKKKFLGIGKNVNGLGELGIATEAAVALASGFMFAAGKFLDKLKQSGILQEVDKIVPGKKASITATPASGSAPTDSGSGSGSSGKNSITTILIVLAALAGVGVVAFSGKKHKK
jgi:hypothetical protein